MEISDTKTAIVSLVVIAGLITGIVIATGKGTEHIDVVFSGVIGAIAGMVVSK